MTADQDIDWPQGWGGLDPEQAEDCTWQLMSELGPHDPLFPWFETGAIRAIGGSVTSNEVIFEIDDWETPYFVSNLTWTAPDRRPNWLQRLAPRERPDPGLVPVSSLDELRAW